MLSMNAMSKRTVEKAQAVFSKYGLEVAAPVVRQDWIKGDYYVVVPSKTMPVAGNKKILDALRADGMPIMRSRRWDDASSKLKQNFNTRVEVKFSLDEGEVPVCPK